MMCALTLRLENFFRVSPAEFCASSCFLFESTYSYSAQGCVLFSFSVSDIFNFVLEGQDFWVVVIILLD